MDETETPEGLGLSPYRRTDGLQRTNVERERDRAICARYYLQGYAMDAIAKMIRRSVETVQKDIAHVRTAWMESAIRDYDKSVGEELAKIDNVEMELWSAWRMSMQTKEITRREKREGSAGMRGPTAIGVVTSEQRLPDMEYMKGIQWCIDRRIKLLALDAPPKTNNGIGEGMTPYDPDANKERVVDLFVQFAARISRTDQERDAAPDRVVPGQLAEGGSR